MDETNIWIHLIFIPVIVTSMYGFFYTFAPMKHWFVDFNQPWYKVARMGNYTHMEGKLGKGQFLCTAVTWFWVSLGAIHTFVEVRVGFITCLLGIASFQLFVVPICNADRKANLLGG